MYFGLSAVKSKKNTFGEVARQEGGEYKDNGKETHQHQALGCFTTDCLECVPKGRNAGSS